jgi:hypothetical protein
MGEPGTSGVCWGSSLATAGLLPHPKPHVQTAQSLAVTRHGGLPVWPLGGPIQLSWRLS